MLFTAFFCENNYSFEKRDASFRNVTESYGCLILKMLPWLKLLFGDYSVRLSEPLPKTDDSLVNIVLKLNRIVKSNFC